MKLYVRKERGKYQADDEVQNNAYHKMLFFKNVVNTFQEDNKREVIKGVSQAYEKTLMYYRDGLSDFAVINKLNKSFEALTESVSLRKCSFRELGYHKGLNSCIKLIKARIAKNTEALRNVKNGGTAEGLYYRIQAENSKAFLGKSWEIHKDNGEFYIADAEGNKSRISGRDGRFIKALQVYNIPIMVRVSGNAFIIKEAQ